MKKMSLGAIIGIAVGVGSDIALHAFEKIKK